MRFEQKHAFPRDRATVLKMFSDVRYFKQKIERTGGTAFEVLENERSGDEFRIRYRFLAKADVPLPDFAKKFLNDSTPVVQQDRWNLKTGAGRLDIELRGIPITVACDMQLDETAAGCINTLAFTVKSSVPLIGGKLEKLIAQDIESKSEADLQESLTLLKEY